MSKHVKINFEFYNDILEEDTTESVWAIVVDENQGLYKIDSIPFFVKDFAWGDVVFAELEDENLQVKELKEESGHSTIQIIFFDSNAIQPVISFLESEGCSWEGSYMPEYFSVDVPKDVDYRPVKKFLRSMKSKEKLGFREACLAHQ